MNLVVLVLGKLGGCEFNYLSDVDFVFFYDEDGDMVGLCLWINCEFFECVVGEFVKLFFDSSDLGIVYCVDLWL